MFAARAVRHLPRALPRSQARGFGSPAACARQQTPSAAADARAPLRSMGCAELSSPAGRAQRDAPRWVAEMNNSTSTHTAWAIHGLLGDIQSYAKFARHLEPDCKVFGIAAPELAGGDVEPGEWQHNLQRRAALYAAALQARQPEGPIRLFGMSCGGMIAYEVAVTLQMLYGRKVEWIVAFDTVFMQAEDQSLVNAVNMPKIADALLDSLRDFVPVLKDPEYRRKAHHMVVNILTMMMTYTPSDPFEGTVHLMRAQDRGVFIPGFPELSQLRSPSLGWDLCLAPDRLVMPPALPGCHRSLAQRSFDSLLAYMRNLLPPTHAA